jgi:hypothetical protein
MYVTSNVVVQCLDMVCDQKIFHLVARLHCYNYYRDPVLDYG